MLGLALTGPLFGLPSQEQLDSETEELRARWGLPSLAVSLIDGDEYCCSVSGRRSAHRQGLAQLEDVYNWGSISKMLTVQLIEQLVAEKKLSWSDRLGQMLPDCPMREEFATVKLSQLASHYSGLPDNLDPSCYPDESWNDAEVPATLRRDCLELIMASTPLKTEYRYSNLGYIVLARVVESVTGQSWNVLVRNRIFLPNDMRSASVGYTWPEWVDPLWLHRWDGEDLIAYRPQIRYGNTRLLDGADQARGSIVDLTRFGRAQMQRPRGAPWPYGWVAWPHPSGAKDRLLFFHNGSNTFQYAALWLDPHRRQGVCLATNVGSDAKGSIRKTASCCEAIFSSLWKSSFETTGP